MEMLVRDLGKQRKKKYLAPWTVYGMNWSVRPDKRFRLAIGSFIEDYKNKVSARVSLSLSLSLGVSVRVCVCACVEKEIVPIYIPNHLQLQIIQLDEDRGEFVLRATFDHPYPTTKIMWISNQTAQLPDLVATSGDYLRLWRVNESQVRQECMLNNVSSVAAFGVHLLCHILSGYSLLFHVACSNI